MVTNDAGLAVEGFEVQKNRIDARIAEIHQMLGGSTAPAALTDTGKPRKKRSAAVRRKMALAQRARYAKLKQASAPQPSAPATTKTNGFLTNGSRPCGSTGSRRTRR
jgi:FKBP-type peptidyl-prolyl cis-trans isomerase (trigger factor)